VKEVYTSDGQRAAVDYRERGWAPIPLKIRSKEPKLPKGHPFLGRKATDEEFGGFDFRHNVGIVAGKVSGILILDDDDGGETLRRNGWHIPATPTVKTKRGHQYYFHCPETGFPTFDVAGKLEVRGDGAYVAAPPSVHPSGDRYEWAISPDEAELAEPPTWLTEQVRLRGRRMRAEDVGETISNGARNKTLFSIAGTLRRRGLDEAAIAAALRGINATKCETPLDEAEVRKIAKSAARYDPAQPQAVPEEPSPNGHPEREAPRRNLTDLGNAERFVDEHGGLVRYCNPWKKWLVFDGKHWTLDDTGEVERKMKITVRRMYAEAANEEDDHRRRELAKHAKSSESKKRIHDALQLAQTESGIPVLPDDLDRDPWLLNIDNGTLDLRTGDLHAHRREDLITKLAPVEYRPQAEAPRFFRFLSEVFAGDKDLIAFVRRFAGYSLTGSTRERVFAILHGFGKNGKTTLVELFRDVLGDYATNTATETVLARRSEGINNDVAALKGARFASTAEVEQDRRLAESKVKALTGSDTVTARKLYGEPFDFKPQFKLWLSTNHKPVIRGTDDAIWDRIRLIPFAQRFEGAKADPKLPEKLREELPGVLAWMVRGCLEWQRDGLGQPEKVRTATEGYRTEMDVLAAFLEERCVVDPGVWVKFADLYGAYTDWCDETGEKAETKRRFGDRLKERGFEPDRGTGNVTIRRGIGLRDDRHPAPDGGSGVTTGQESYPRVTDSNPDSYRESGEGSYPSYSTNSNSTANSAHEKNYQEEGNYSNYSNSNEASITPREGSRRQLTPEEAERVQRLIRQGMSPKFARAEVLGEEP
jgi:putative DNA primase/helicase